MPLDNIKSTQIPAHIPQAGGLADRASSLNPPNGNTGGTLRHSSIKNSKSNYLEDSEEATTEPNIGSGDASMAQTTPHLRTRAKSTNILMNNFLERWFFDWLTVTIPNISTGRGTKSKNEKLNARQEAEALDRLTSWAATSGLRKQRIGRGSDGYLGGLNLAFDPTDSERLATIRAGHGTNMPGLEIPGGRGHCAVLAPLALEALGPVMLARADVALDVKREGLFEELHDLCEEFARDRKKMERPTTRGEEGKGRTVYFGGKGASVKIYEKGKERVANGTAEVGDDDAADDLVRIEFTIKGEKTKQKHGLAKIAAEEGPGALLGTVCWIRHFVERLAVIVGEATEEDAILAVKRLSGRPDPRPVEKRAKHGRDQYAGVFIAEAAKGIVKKQNADWESVVLDYDELVDAALLNIFPAIQQAADQFITFGGIGLLRESERQAADLKFDLSIWLERFQSQTMQAKELLGDAEKRALKRSGMAEWCPDGLVPF